MHVLLTSLLFYECFCVLVGGTTFMYTFQLLRDGRLEQAHIHAQTTSVLFCATPSEGDICASDSSVPYISLLFMLLSNISLGQAQIHA